MEGTISRCDMVFLPGSFSASLLTWLDTRNARIVHPQNRPNRCRHLRQRSVARRAPQNEPVKAARIPKGSTGWKCRSAMLAAGAVACVLFEPLWLAPSLLEYADWSRQWVAPDWIWALWLGFAVSFNYCLAWLRPKLLLAALFGAFGGVFSVTVGINFGAATTPQGVRCLCRVPG